MIRRFIYFMAITTVLFTSCKKYLETDSPSSFSNDYVFSHEYDMFNALKGVYALLTQDAGYSTRLSFYYTLNSDVEITRGPSDGGRHDIAEFTCNTSNSEVLQPWNNCYLAIDRANGCIQGIKNSPLYATSANVKQMYGEAIALRAQMYYELVRNWGDVPYKTTPTVAGDNFYLPRTDRDTILSNCINDLIKAEPDMLYADQLPEGIERMNRGFVQGLIARLALTRGGYSLRSDVTGTMAMKRNDADYLSYYQIANKYCKMLVASNKHALEPSFKTIFMNECKFVTPKNSDVLYEIAFPATYSSDLGNYNGIRIAAGTQPYGSGDGLVCFPPTYFYSFDTTDTRLPVTCALYSLDGTLKQVIADPNQGGITTGKWSKSFMATPQGPASTKLTGINWPIMRYSDVLLMLAETENEINNGPTDVAKNALTQVRQRAFPTAVWPTKVTQYVTTISANKASFFNAIVNERAWEFGGECLRKFDLIRWNLYGKTIGATRLQLIQMGLDTRFGTGQGAYLTFPDKVYWKLNADNTLSIAGLYKKLAAAPTGYTSANWLKNLANTDQTPSSFITDMFNGYTDNTGVAPVRYILPIHQSVIQASLGNLKNYYNY